MRRERTLCTQGASAIIFWQYQREYKHTMPFEKINKVFLLQAIHHRSLLVMISLIDLSGCSETTGLLTSAKN